MSVGTNQSSFSELITLAQFGDQEAITELYNRTYSAVYHTTKALIRDEDTAQDVLQDAYIKGFQNLDKLRQPEQYQAWMKMIATNTAKNVLKRKKPILFSEMENEDGEMEVEFVDDRVEHLPEVAMDRRETSRLVSEILDTLPDDQRLVMGMFYYEEMSIQQIARTLGISENTVKSRLNYGRKKVEVKVRDLEKRGTKLYSLAPLPFLLWLLRMQASAEAMPSAAVLDAITAECAGMAFGEASAFTAAAETAETAASQSGKFAAQSAKSTARAGAQSAVKTGAKAAGNTAVKAAAKGGAKAVGTKIIAGVLAASLAGGGIYYGADKILNRSEQSGEQSFFSGITAKKETGTAEPQIFELRPDGLTALDGNVPRATEPTVQPTEQAAPKNSNSQNHTAYQPVLNNYAQVLGVDSNTFNQNPDAYYNGDHMAVYNYHARGNLEFKYAYYDINQDGTDELLIGVDDPGDGMNPGYHGIVDVYGFDGGQAVQLLDENVLGSWRANLSLHTDGSMHFTSTMGASDHSDVWYTLLGTYMASASPSNAPEVTDIPWQKLDASDTAPSFNAPDAVSGAEAAFDEILRQYAAAWNEPASGRDYGAYEAFMQNTYPDVKISADFWGHAQFGSNILKYAFQDLNGDGTAELFINIAYDETPVYANVLEGFYFDGQKAVRMGKEIGVLGDGVIVQLDEYGAVQALKVLTANGLADYQGSTSLRTGVLWGPQDISAHGGDMQFAWKPIDQAAARNTSSAGSSSFDSIRADIRTACKITDYDSNSAYYDNLYSHLGNGVMWMLCNREVPQSLGIGATIYNVFCTEFDIDGDGEKELCVAKGITPQHTPLMIAIYDRTGNGITPIYADALFSCLEPYEYGELPVSITEWEYLTL